MSDTTAKKNVNASINLLDYASVLVIVCIIALISNWTGTGITPLSALPGMVIIFGMVIIGLALAKYMPFYLPSVAWLSLVSVVLTIPASPVSEFILTQVKEINFLSLVSPVLAYAGIAISKQEVSTFKTAGGKVVIIALLVFTGTYLGSAIIANLSL
ncbi:MULTISPECIES: hypothetical protein [Vibrio]|uniref:DUF340 domain-containing protein n=1 Tax=Vibrio ostreae TaxID=2841925 RepID=A0A975YLW7_9VIBR|nr:MULTISPECIES: hypothetical protein [Vibrio]QXO16097.1 hypothetical protein KNV97_00780 [Vibrio ostreae]WGY44871.1 hypothetical protein J0X00_03950 [Vibrio sp. ABG19]